MSMNQIFQSWTYCLVLQILNDIFLSIILRKFKGICKEIQNLDDVISMDSLKIINQEIKNNEL